jgi:hypothetical protein
MYDSERGASHLAAAFDEYNILATPTDRPNFEATSQPINDKVV